MSIASKPLIGSQSNECLVCEHSNDVEYWDTERYLDLPWPDKHEGRKFVCRDCVRDAATLFGFLAPEDAKLLQDRNAYLESQLVFENKIEELKQAVQDASAEISAPWAGVVAPFADAVPDETPAKTTKKAPVDDPNTTP